MAYIWVYPTTPEGVSKISHCHIFPWSTSFPQLRFSIPFRRTIILRNSVGELLLQIMCLWRKGQRKMYYGKCGSRGGGGKWIYNEWMVILIIDCLSYGFKTSKTQTAHLLSISGVNFILFAWKTSHSGIQQNRLCGVFKVIATNLLFYLLIWTL